MAGTARLTSAVGPTSGRREAILATAARLFHERGFEGTSIQEVAEACGLTKAGLYHHIRSKQDLLVEILVTGLDLFELQVVRPALRLHDPRARLRSWILGHVRLINQPGCREATLLLHEPIRLPAPARARIRERQRRLVRQLESLVREALRSRQVKGVDPKVAAFGMLGMVLWTSRWFRFDGPLSCEQVAQELAELFLGGLLRSPADPAGQYALPIGWRAAQAAPGWS